MGITYLDYQSGRVLRMYDPKVVLIESVLSGEAEVLPAAANSAWTISRRQSLAQYIGGDDHSDAVGGERGKSASTRG